jgi:hypothetical protein
MKFKSFALSFFTLCATAAFGATAAEAVEISTITTTPLSNAIHTTFGSDGSLYVMEGGIGGDGDGGRRCTPSPSTQFVPICAGNTGAITRIKDGVQERIIDGLPSLAQQTEILDQGAGPADLQFDPLTGKTYLLFGMAGDPRTRDSVLELPEIAKLYEIDLNTGEFKRTLADFAEYEINFNPDGTDLIVNPYNMAIKDGFAYVTDGGANVVYKVGLNGEGIVKANALPRFNIPPEDLNFPSPEDLGLGPEQSIAFEPTQQSVPTGIKIAPNGDIYLTEYTFFPYPEGNARVWKIDEDLNPTLVAEGFTQVTDLEFDENDNLLLLQHYNIPEWQALAPDGDKSGSIIRLLADGTQEVLYSSPEIGAGGSLTKGPDGAYYVTSDSRFGLTGAVKRIELDDSKTKVPEPGSVAGLVVAAAFGANAMLKKRKRQEELLDKVETL